MEIRSIRRHELRHRKWFKIDLIVWKWLCVKCENFSELQFKIDLIVWKLNIKAAATAMIMLSLK